MTKNANPLGRPIVLTGFAATVVIAVGAFILSFASLTDLAGRSGIDRSLAWIWPIIVDGLIVAATVAIVALSGHDRKTLAYPWTLLFFGAVVSTAANAVHAILSVDQIHGTVPPIVSAVVASMPPVVLLAITHLTVVLVQKSSGKPGRKVTVPRRAVKPVPATRLVVALTPGHDPVAAPSHGLDHPQPVAA